MLKKILLLALVVLTTIAPSMAYADELMDITHAAGYTDALEINRPKSSIIIDANTGDVLWEDNADEVRDPASMSKLMTLYLTFEAIHNGEITPDTIITATPSDEATANIYEISNNHIVAGVDYTVAELITMTAVPSSNATTVMLANYLSNNDPDAFLDKMNATSQELGMKNTKWFNASGAAAVAFKGYYAPQRYDIYAANETTARDLAVLGYYFVKNYPDILKYTKEPVVTVKAGTPYEETFTTYNYSLPGASYGIEGVDGLKTGSSPQGAFNYIATAKRGDQRIVSVIMGVGDWSDQNGEYYRHPFGNALMEKAFADYEYKLVLKKGQHEIDGKKYDIPEDFYATVKKGTEPTFKVENGQLRVDNGLTTVLSSISDSISVSADGQTEKQETSTGKSTEVKEVANSAVSIFSKFWKYLLLLIPVVVIILIIIIERAARKKKREEALQSGRYSRRDR